MKHRLLAISIYFLEATWMIIRQILKLRNPVVWNPPMNKVSRSLMAVDSGRCKSKTASIGSLSFSERTICLRFDNMPKIKLSKVFLAEIKYSIYYCINLIDGTLLSSINFKYTCNPSSCCSSVRNFDIFQISSKLANQLSAVFRNNNRVNFLKSSNGS